MSKRIATVLAPEDLGASGTKIIKINLSDIVSRLSISFKATVATASEMLDAVTACLSKIELVDGGEVLYSVSGAELQGINFYDRLVMPHHKISLTVGGSFEVAVGLDFGRWLWDSKYAFDPRKFKNPQLELTYDEDACNTGVTENECTVYAYVDDAPPEEPVGMLVNRRVKEYAMAASSHEYTDLPTDRKIRKLILRGYSTDHDPIGLFDTLKLDIDNAKFIPLDIKASQYDKLLAAKYPRIVESYTLDNAVTAKTLYSALSKDQQISISYDGTQFVTAQSKFAVATWTGAKCALSASVDIKALNAEISGRYPANCIPVDFGVSEDPESWLKANEVGSLVLDLLSSSDADGGDSAMIVVQQEYVY